MIRTLKLENFRRHESTELDFSSDAQIIAITGRNGAGKTTILEAMCFAFYGETRHGRRGVHNLVRRGAEHEGMGVSCEFVVAGTLYRIERRMEKGKHSAALYANDTLHTKTADGVTDAITQLLGMDSVGFRLATIARQKELDGLAEMTPAVRRRNISRLLRLDAVAAAVQAARDSSRTAKIAADALAAAASVPECTAAAELARVAVEEAQAAHTESATLVAGLDAKIGATSDVEGAYREAMLAQSRAEAVAESARNEHSRILAEVAAHKVPAPTTPPARSLTDVTAALTELAETIATGQASQALIAQRDSASRRLAEAQAAVDATDRELESARGQVVDVDALLRAADEARDGHARVAAALENTVVDLAGVQTRLAAVRQRAANLDGVGDVCDSCGQDVPDEHRHTTADRLDTEAAELEARVTELTGQAAEQRRVLAELGETRTRMAEAAQAGHRAAATVADLESRRETAASRIEVYRSEIGRLAEQVVEVDLPAAYARRTELEALRLEAEEYGYAELARQVAVEKAEALEARRAASAERLAVAEQAFRDAAPAEDLVAAWQERARLVAEREGERELLEALAAELAAARATAEAADRALAEATRTAERVSAHRTESEVAAKTATVLEAMSRRMATQIRPQLEGQISALLQLMSEGRFTAVSVSDDYELTVCDHDGKFHPVSEFSGGEADLVALALRLALAQVVAARHGAGGAGFLILDEVFGSQDEGRRNAILDALRRLRGTYGQILLISHIPGIEDAADMVLSVGRDDEEETARVAVLAG